MAKLHQVWEKEVSAIRIGNRAQLDNFLKILSEESASEKLGRLEAGQKETTVSIKKDLSKYGPVEEQEDPAEEEEPVEDEEDPAEEDEEEPDPEGEEGLADDEGEPPPEGEEGEEGSGEGEATPDVTYYRVRDQINDIRAAPSLKGRGPKQDIEQWLSRLGDSEKEALYVYLDTVDKIMRGQVSGTDAQDPSDPPISLNIQGGDEGEEPSPEEAPAGEEEEVSPEDEDTSPPIVAGAGAQDISEIRKRVQSLMRG